MENDQLPEGLYYCSACGKKTEHQYLQDIPAIIYESASTEEIERLEREKPEILTCVICKDEILQEEEE